MATQTLSLTRLPNVASATLPVSYERAKAALATCSRVDECKAWADKAQALASYAKQAGDKSLQTMATRIQARAIRRCGALLRQIEPKHTGRPKNGAASGPISRKEAATSAGLSARQRKTALRVANVSEEEFEAAVESETPATVESLAARGMTRVRQAASRPGYKEATTAIGMLRRLAEFAEAHEPGLVAAGVTQPFVHSVYADVARIDAWLDAFVTQIGDGA